jgi:hypothetical protein
VLAVLRGSLTSLFCAAVLFALAGNAMALVRTATAPTSLKKKVSTVIVTGPSVKCHQWGFMEVQIKVVKTVVGTGASAKVTIKLLSVTWPIFPNHTSKSIYINNQALPLLKQETLQLQAAAGSKLENIAGATHTTVSWRASMQAALAQALKP